MRLVRYVCLPAVPFLIALMVASASAAERRVTDIPKKLDEKTAQNLAANAYREGMNLEYFDPDPNMDPPFYDFDGVNRAPVNGSFGFFAVNPWTGDVWALWGCYKMSSPTVRKLQPEIRGRFTPNEMKHYARLRRLKPFCAVEAPQK